MSWRSWTNVRQTTIRNVRARDVSVVDASGFYDDSNLEDLLATVGGFIRGKTVAFVGADLTNAASYIEFAGALPSYSLIWGVTLHVTTTITGPTSIDIGYELDDDAYGSAIALTSGTKTSPGDFSAAPYAQPIVVGNADNVLRLTANGGTFEAVGAGTFNILYTTMRGAGFTE